MAVPERGASQALVAVVRARQRAAGQLLGSRDRLLAHAAAGRAGRARLGQRLAGGPGGGGLDAGRR
ncbi:MAG TPA: hypothetical protein VF518_01635 [Polyangia bacterium]